jgi:hypothetical protein
MNLKNHFRASALREAGRQSLSSGGDAMQIEITVPDDWSPELTMSIRSLFQHAVNDGYPLVTWARRDADPEEVKRVFSRIQALMKESGLET